MSYEHLYWYLGVGCLLLCVELAYHHWRKNNGKDTDQVSQSSIDELNQSMEQLKVLVGDRVFPALLFCVIVLCVFCWPYVAYKNLSKALGGKKK
ncbi:TPA: hypothetical protein JFP82_002225 [Vibrio cholerae O1]|uniref:hypothetical protein n=1 Tax=Vibrio cholerae TaxID=666 RepID=UPI0012EB9D57|nr:hypothetical protein [Vibrio cholerae]EGQ8013226.1 hypothetical protein [Vibrio cholerae]MBY4642006.1 hypothetical protein [Vibrio cholerae]MCR9658278.1 hypothetical protein [Vibrio cholerae]MCR9688959.1 hypothetical protein [Vibrio cholerae]MCR9737467.1 hypothetical protein [Vibrio cholerae]